MLLWLWIVGCTHVFEAPVAWSGSGCDANPVGSAGDGQTDDRELVERAWRLSREDGVELQVRTRARRDADCMGAVIMVPQGLEPGADQADAKVASRLAEHGLYVVAFDPRGRGDSDGEEDANGSLGQDDLAALLRVVSEDEDVDPTNIVIYSRSFGGAMASGALARHADLVPVSWVDYESPGWLEEDLDHTSEHTADRFRELASDSGDEDEFWAERQPAGFIGQVLPSYRRLQGLPDHALDYMGAAVAMLNGATAARSVWLNGTQVSDPLSADEVREAAVPGGLSPGDALVTDQILAAFDDD